MPENRFYLRNVYYQLNAARLLYNNRIRPSLTTQYCHALLDRMTRHENFVFSNAGSTPKYRCHFSDFHVAYYETRGVISTDLSFYYFCIFQSDDMRFFSPSRHSEYSPITVCFVSFAMSTKH